MKKQLLLIPSLPPIFKIIALTHLSDNTFIKSSALACGFFEI